MCSRVSLRSGSLNPLINTFFFNSPSTIPSQCGVLQLLDTCFWLVFSLGWNFNVMIPPLPPPLKILPRVKSDEPLLSYREFLLNGISRYFFYRCPLRVLYFVLCVYLGKAPLPRWKIHSLLQSPSHSDVLSFFDGFKTIRSRRSPSPRNTCPTSPPLGRRGSRVLCGLPDRELLHHPPSFSILLCS